MIERWTLQGRRYGDSEWIALYTERRIKDLPKVDQRLAKYIGAEYKIAMVTL